MLPVIPLLAMATLGLAAVGDVEANPPGLLPVVRWPNGWALYRVVSKEGIEEAKTRAGIFRSVIPFLFSTQRLLALLPPVLNRETGEVGVLFVIGPDEQRSPYEHKIVQVYTGFTQGDVPLDPFVPKALRSALFSWLGLSPEIGVQFKYTGPLLGFPVLLPDDAVDRFVRGSKLVDLEAALRDLEEDPVRTKEKKAVYEASGWVYDFEKVLRGLRYPWKLKVERWGLDEDPYWTFSPDGWFDFRVVPSVDHLQFVVTDRWGHILSSSDNSPLDAILASGLFVLESDWPAWAARNGEPGEPFVDTDIFVLLDEGNPVLWPPDRFLDLWRQL